jgi:hypothetical protein
MAEDAVQALVRLRASQLGWRLFRNNVGVLQDVTGRPVRYGLANDSKQMNTEYKSGDLIGIMPVVITPEHVGHTLGVFASVECKREGWRPTASDKRYEAQCRWRDLVLSLGGYARIVTGPEQL